MVMKKFEERIDFSTVNRGAVEKDERLSLIAGSLMSKLIVEDAVAEGGGSGGDPMSFQSISLANFMKVSSSTVEGLNIFGNRRAIQYTFKSSTKTITKVIMKIITKNASKSYNKISRN